jgi:hypothetical protein
VQPPTGLCEVTLQFSHTPAEERTKTRLTAHEIFSLGVLSP